ncbi:hypothetical protein [Sneathiella glossodoripedis]|uniref:hypothetical protein n=1 Tax=Sneathiella glossodoripedis TaxID=418853 RepID=UPI00046F2307|nr:hypothetical protein [Sneathiella glossodoripedis]
MLHMLITMEIHEVIKLEVPEEVNGFNKITRVPNGWIYSTNSYGVFVPFNSECNMERRKDALQG